MRTAIATIVFMIAFCMMMYPVMIIGFVLMEPRTVVELWQPLIGIGGLLLMAFAAVTGVFGKEQS